MTNAQIAPEANEGENFTMIQGFYEAPTDGKYLFHLDCDRDCNLLMSLDPSRPEQTESIINEKSTSSDWVALKKGQKYYMESHLNYMNREGHW